LFFCDTTYFLKILLGIGMMAISSLVRIVGRSEFSKNYILQAFWWLKSPMRDAHDLLYIKYLVGNVIREVKCGIHPLLQAAHNAAMSSHGHGTGSWREKANSGF
jgi:hypothetical protein